MMRKRAAETSSEKAAKIPFNVHPAKGQLRTGRHAAVEIQRHIIPRAKGLKI